MKIKIDCVVIAPTPLGQKKKRPLPDDPRLTYDVGYYVDPWGWMRKIIKRLR